MIALIKAAEHHNALPPNYVYPVNTVAGLDLI
jgi:hypothetical protein